MNNIILFIIAVVLTEALTELVVKSKIFEPLRKFFFDRRDHKLFSFLNELFDCGYCFSVWSGTCVGLLLVDLNLVHFTIDWLIVGILLHRLSNILHNVIDRIRTEVI